MQKNVVLIHGFLLSSWVMKYLGTRMQSMGYRAHYFKYPSRQKTVDQIAKDLNDFVSHIDEPIFIAHSLGGLVVRAYLEHHRGISPVVTIAMGSPLNGSSVAQFLGQSRLGRGLLGKQHDGALQNGFEHWPDPHILGMIAGGRPIGVGPFLGLVDSKQSDGTVSIAETKISNCVDHITLATTHTFLTFSNTVAFQSDYFIKHKQFKHPDND